MSTASWIDGRTERHLENHMKSIIGPDGRTYLPMPQTKVTPPKEELPIGRISSPWKVYGRTLGIVLLSFMMVQFLVVGVDGILNGDPWMAFCGGVFGVPFIATIIFIQRPKIMDVRIATPHPNGSNYHVISEHQTLWTPMPTLFTRHLIRDSSALDIPTSRRLWTIFFGLISTSILISIGLWLEIGGALMMIVAVGIGIPFFLLGFSIPVMGWWAISREKLGLMTRERDAESWLFLGMMSAFPAILINSFLFPSIIGAIGIEMSAEALMNWTAVISAPLGEEICKGIAVAVFFGSMNSGKRGFQIGFTVGLGFALIENLQYILISFGGGFTGFTLTSLIRGIGSIPGHAFWTGITGFSIGMLASKNNHQLNGEAEKHQNQIWKLFDPKTGEEIHDDSNVNNTILTPLDEQPHDWFAISNHELVPKMQNVGIGILPPSNIGLALLTAIGGHALWNGAAVGAPWFAFVLTQSEGISVLVTLLTTILMVCGVLGIGNLILNGVAEEDKNRPH